MVKDQQGQSLLEFALIVPILILLVSGIFDFGRVFYTYMNLHHLTQETVRLGGLGKTDTEISQFAESHFQLGDPSSLSISITPSENSRKSGDYITVTLSYPVTYATPGVALLFSSHHIVTTDSTIRIE
ncbi:TadE/TadG family type IV pilus assembly protein [Clostridiaceae bacterium 35-E11]